jgi:hypothetical protein
VAGTVRALDDGDNWLVPACNRYRASSRASLSPPEHSRRECEHASTLPALRLPQP